MLDLGAQLQCQRKRQRDTDRRLRPRYWRTEWLRCSPGGAYRSNPCEAAASGITYNHMVVTEAPRREVDRIFHTLADATRRDIVRTVLIHEQSVSTLARRYPMSFAAVQKHVAVLEDAGLV